jgi:uncharacterized protein DUF4410
MFSPRRSGMTILSIGLTLWVGCGEPARGPVVPGPRLDGGAIAVAPFDSSAAEVVSYDLPYQELGRDLAADIAAELRRRGHESDVVPGAIPPADGAVVRGRIVRINGGSRALRFWIGLGAGRAQLAVEGTVERADGTKLASFRVQRSSSGEAQLGVASDYFLVEKCRRVLAGDVAEMIDTGQYREQ